MIFRKNLKAGTLLYALLMLGIFALLLQFYIQSQLATGRISQVSQKESQAYFMAQMTKEEAAMIVSQSVEKKEESNLPDQAELPSSKEDKLEKEASIPNSGAISFTNGRAIYERTGQYLQIQVMLNSGQTYAYRFPISSEN